MARFLDFDPVTRTSSIFHYDHVEDASIVETVQDVTDIAELNKAQDNARPHKDKSWKGDMHHVARIPLTLYFELNKKFGADERLWKKWLNDRDNLVFRTRAGRI